MDTTGWLTIDEASALKGVHRNSIERAIRSGRLPAAKKGRIYLVRPVDLKAWQPVGHKPRGWQGRRFFRCPDCQKKGVYWAARPYGEDNYSCRYCSWYAFTRSNADVDVRQLQRFQDANPDRAEEL